MFSVSSPEGVRMVFTTYVTSCGTALTLSPLPHSNRMPTRRSRRPNEGFNSLPPHDAPGGPARHAHLL
jgi:hypothetical protein